MRRRDLVLLLAVLAPAGCADPPAPRVGVVVSRLPETAATMAAEQGGLEPVIAEPSSATDAEEAIRVATELTDDRRVIAVVGHSNSAGSLAAAHIYNARGLPQIAPTSTAPAYGAAGQFSFRLVPSDTLQSRFIATVVHDRWPDARHVAVVYVNDDYGRGLYRTLREDLNGVSYTGVYADAGPQEDLDVLAEGLTASGADVLVWLGRPRALGDLRVRLKAAGRTMPVVCADGCDIPLTYSNADGALTGVHFVRFTDPDADDERIRRFQKEYRTRTGQVATTEALLTYDAFRLVDAAVRDGARTREQVRRWLASLGHERPPFDGITGPIRFNESGDVIRSYRLAEVRGPGEVVPADRAD